MFSNMSCNKLKSVTIYKQINKYVQNNFNRLAVDFWMFFGCFVFSSSFLCSFFGVSDLPPGDQGFYTFLPSFNFVPACVNKSVDVVV